MQLGVADMYDEKCDSKPNYYYFPAVNITLVWSFGMVLVEMVTLNSPYFGISSQQATQSITLPAPLPPFAFYFLIRICFFFCIA